MSDQKTTAPLRFESILAAARAILAQGRTAQFIEEAKARGLEVQVSRELVEFTQAFIQRGISNTSAADPETANAKHVSGCTDHAFGGR